MLLSLATSGYAVLDAFDLNPLKLIGQQISPKITGYVKQELFGDPTYRNQLAKVVDTVLDQYRVEYGVTSRSRAVFFFQLQWIWDRVLAYRLFQATSPLKVADLPQLAQVAGALYLGFAFLNWMARSILIGGIYARPVAVGNLLHFLAGALALGKQAPTVGSPLLWVLAGVYTLLAALFGWVTFTHPRVLLNK